MTGKLTTKAGKLSTVTGKLSTHVPNKKLGLDDYSLMLIA